MIESNFDPCLFFLELCLPLSHSWYRRKLMPSLRHDGSHTSMGSLEPQMIDDQCELSPACDFSLILSPWLIGVVISFLFIEHITEIRIDFCKILYIPWFTADNVCVLPFTTPLFWRHVIMGLKRDTWGIVNQNTMHQLMLCDEFAYWSSSHTVFCFRFHNLWW